ncbi:hypothetical protein Thimo_0016 [Thioflavicoccus mobilis 8321]|uniref:Uncharacterized protein n=1 Tax=Thioflavicoccus mobilis 8321 TaxID=765912 RepID=L0GQ57_9GAMM|nr:hypothetical protein [Thioflavicoccus mobilis]AGA88893.1 hypothetical protein Thimo_0016 [Thioflavicoccus mobilis 8321]
MSGIEWTKLDLLRFARHLKTDAPGQGYGTRDDLADENKPEPIVAATKGGAAP